MAHFAELDQNDFVLRVVVVDNADITNPQGQEEEQLGIDLLVGLFGENTRWKQTSYNASFRGRYAGIGMKYDAALDEFVIPAETP